MSWWNPKSWFEDEEVNIREDVNTGRLDELEHRISVQQDALKASQREAQKMMHLAESAIEQKRVVEDSLYRLQLEDRNWISVGGNTSKSYRDLSNQMRTRLAKESWEAYSYNPRAFRITQSFKNMIVSRHLNIRSNQPEIHIAIMKFKQERRNKWLWQLTQLVNRMFFEGEIYLRFWIKKDGTVIMREVPPQEILDVVRNPNDRSVEFYYKKLLPRNSSSNSVDTLANRMQATLESKNFEYIPSVEIFYYDDVKKALLETPEFQKNAKLFMNSMQGPKNFKSWTPSQIIKALDPYGTGSTERDSDAQLIDTAIRDDGDVPIDFHSFILHIDYPTVSDRYRGFAPMQPILKVLKQYREIIQTRLIMAKLRSTYVYDIAVEGSPGEVLAEAKKHKFPPAPGSVNVHSSKIVHSLIYPSTGADDVRGDIRALSLETVAGSQLPEHIGTGDASNANFASLRDTKYSFASVVESWQDIWEYAIREMFRFVLESNIKTHGGSDVKKEYNIEERFATDEEKEITKKIPKHPADLVEITFPDTGSLSELEQAQFTQIVKELGFAADDTLAARLGYDLRNREKALIMAQRRRETEEFIENEKLMQSVMPQQPMPGQAGPGGGVQPPTGTGGPRQTPGGGGPSAGGMGGR